MRSLVKLDYKLLYLLWAVMFVVTAVLGFLYPSVKAPAERFPLQLAAGAFFLPPWAILTKAKVQENVKHVHLVRNLTVLSLAATVALLCANMMSVGMSEQVGNALHAALTIVSAPLVCSNFYLMPLFLWGTLLMGSLSDH